MLKRKTWAAIAVAGVCLVVVLGAIFLRPYDIRELQGNATISDSGFWSYPRYKVRLPAVSLSKPVNYVFTVRGLPPAPLTFILNLADFEKKEAQVQKEFQEFYRNHPRNVKFQGKLDQNQSPDQLWKTYEIFHGNETIVEFTWSCNGETISTGAGPLKNWQLKWVPAYQSGGYWHPNGRKIKFHRGQAYRLNLKITNVDVNAPPLTVVPTLEGGGTELP